MEVYFRTKNGKKHGRGLELVFFPIFTEQKEQLL
jgi:hypothetical protein